MKLKSCSNNTVLYYISHHFVNKYLKNNRYRDRLKINLHNL